MKDLAFYLGIGALFTHELDAMPNHEWRVLPLLRALPDDMGMAVFVIAHVPLFALLTALIASSNVRTRMKSRLIISGFLVVHALVHALFLNHPSYEFSSMLSNTLIFGGAVFGAIYLGLEAWSTHENSPGAT
jgi:hypothetical protein